MVSRSMLTRRLGCTKHGVNKDIAWEASSKRDSGGPGDNIENLWERSRSTESKATMYRGNSERRRTFHPGIGLIH
jgi:hypothetical protein